MSTFSENLKALRLKKGLTLKELEVQISVSYTQLRRWENGATSPSIDNAAMLAQFFKVSLDELYGLKSESTGLDVSGLSKEQLQALKMVVACFN